MDVEYGVLGPVHVSRDGRELDLGTPQQCAVLGLLLLAEGRPLSLDQLVDGMWGAGAPATAVATVRTYLSRLRHVLPSDRPGSVIRSVRGGYQLSVEPGTLDVTLFEERVRRAREARSAGDPVAAVTELRTGLALWRGDALGGARGEYVDAERDRLESLRLLALEDRITLDMELARHAEILPELAMLTRLNPLNERLRQLHMLALYRNGQQADALQVYREVHELLVSELGIEPGGELRSLQDRILHADPELDGPNRPPAQAVSRASLRVSEDDGDTPRTAISEERPTPLQSFLAARLRAGRERTFVGRDTERAMFASMLADAEHGFAAMYLHGPAGIGKSALLRQFADDAAAAGRRVVPVCGKVIGASVAAFTDAASPALSNPRAVLMIDTFERCADLEGWLRDQFLPRLPDGVAVAVAGRQPPEPAWRVDPSWSGALLVHRLDGLSLSEADHLVQARGLPADVRESVLAFGGGQPLALSLAAETARRCVSAAGSAGRNADVRKALLAELIDATPSFYHRMTLYVAAHAHATGERLIRATVPCSGSINADSTALFTWLRAQPFMIKGPKVGLYFPNDIVRELLDNDGRSLDPIAYKVMHDKIAAYELERLAGQDLLADHREHPVDHPIRQGGRRVARRSA